jgi:hypothetical protein
VMLSGSAVYVLGLLQLGRLAAMPHGEFINGLSHRPAFFEFGDDFLCRLGGRRTPGPLQRFQHLNGFLNIVE